MSVILGIDQSTSATKAMLFDASGRILDKASRDHRQIYPRAGWVEHDPEEIWQNLKKVVEELCQRNDPLLDEVIGLSIANQRETFIVFDRMTGEPLHNAIVWQCRRGDSLCEEFRAGGGDRFVREKTGLKLDTYFPAAKIAWLMRAQPHIADQLRSGAAVIGTIDTFLVHRLTAGGEFATDPTNASRTLLYDVHKLQWNEQLCALFGVPMQALAEIRESCDRFGETDVCGLLKTKVPIRGVMGDSQASLFAQQCFQPGSGKATFGTGTSILVNAGRQVNQSCEGAVLALAWVIQDRPTYALEGIINYSSATIAWLKDQLGLIADAAESESVANEVEDNGGVYLVPAFSGLSAPHWNSAARAAIVGMSGHTRKAHIVRAALEAIGFQIRDVLDMIHAEAGISPRRMRADGGPTRNAFLMQFTADITQLEWEVSDVAESSAWGATMIGMLGLGVCRSLNDLTKLPRAGKRYRPKLSKEQAQSLHREWQVAVRRVL